MKYRESQVEKDNRGESYYMDDDDYIVSIVFNNNEEKRDILSRCKLNPKERYIESSVLFDIYEQKYKLIGPYQ